MLLLLWFFFGPISLFSIPWLNAYMRRHLEALEESGQEVDDGIIAEYHMIISDDSCIYKIRYAYQVGETRFMSNRLFDVDRETAHASVVKLKFLPDQPTTATLVFSIQHRQQDYGRGQSVCQVLVLLVVSVATSATVLLMWNVFYAWIGVLAVTMSVGFAWALCNHHSFCHYNTEVAIPIPDDIWTACQEKNVDEIQKFLQLNQTRSRLMAMGGIHAPLLTSLGEILDEYPVDGDEHHNTYPEESNKDDVAQGEIVLGDLKQNGAKSTSHADKTREII
jgi:hypothetical protein